MTNIPVWPNYQESLPKFITQQDALIITLNYQAMIREHNRNAWLKVIPLVLQTTLSFWLVTEYLLHPSTPLWAILFFSAFILACIVVLAQWFWSSISKMEMWKQKLHSSPAYILQSTHEGRSLLNQAEQLDLKIHYLQRCHDTVRSMASTFALICGTDEELQRRNDLLSRALRKTFAQADFGPYDPVHHWESLKAEARRIYEAQQTLLRPSQAESDTDS